MRQGLSALRPAVFVLATHLAKRKPKSIGQEHRIIAEALVAARRPDQRAVDPALEFLQMAVRPGDTQDRDEMGFAAFRREGIALAQTGLDPLHRVAELSLRA